MSRLPTEINVQIFARLDTQSLINVSQTCSSFRQAVLEHQLFKAAATSICPWLTHPVKKTWEATARYLVQKPQSYTAIKSYDTNEILAAFPSVQFKANLDIAFEHEEPVDPDGQVMFETQRSQLDSAMFRVSPEGDGYIYMSPSMSSDVEHPHVTRVNCRTLKSEKVMDGYLLGDPETVEGGLVNYTGQKFSVPEGDISHQTVVDGKLYALLRRYNEVYLLRGEHLLKLPFPGRKQVDIRLHIVHGHAFFTTTSLISLTPQATTLHVVGRDSNTVHSLFDCHPYDIPHNFAVHGEYLYLCKEMKLFQLYCNVEEGKTYLCRIINNPVHYAASKTYNCGQYLLIKSFAGSQVLFDLDNDSMSHIIHDRDVNCIMRYEDELVCFCFSKSMLLGIENS
ncbi:hypothetical protein CJU90_4162 [Yarrowia sp. C11]|nr:hypothetical protein CKK34_6778 [Yarrowia sp. E02]KAG5365102.1 hypothetical protein CJU90_4162 [Yarrowia sp. C11]